MRVVEQHSRVDRAVGCEAIKNRSWFLRAWWRGCFLCILGALVFLGVTQRGWAEGPVPDSQRPLKHGLFVISYHSYHPWTQSIVDKVKEATLSLPTKVIYNVLELDALHDGHVEDWQKKLDQEIPRLQKREYDFVLLLDDPALDLFLLNMDQLPADLPIIFAGIERYSPEIKEKYPNLTGLTQSHNVEGNIQIGLALWPETQEVIVLSDATPTSRFLEKQLKDTLQPQPGVNLFYVNREDTESIEKMMRFLERRENMLLVLNPWRELRGNDYQTVASLGVDIYTLTGKPFLVSDNTLFGYGALGGYMTEPQQYAQEWVKMLGEVLALGSAQQVPVKVGELVPLFDWKLLREYGLDTSLLPNGSQFINRPHTVWEIWKTEILFTAAFVLLVIVFCVGYLFLYRRLTEKNQAIYRALPARVGVCDENERILFLSPTDVSEADRKALYVKEIGGLDYEKISTGIREVFKTGKKITFDYSSAEARRSMTIGPLQKSVYGTSAVIWISHDNSELQAMREKAEALTEQNLENLQALQDTTEMWNFVINSLPINVYAKDPQDDFKYILVNDLLISRVGLTRKEMIGKTDFDFFSWEDAQAYNREDREVVTSNEVREKNEVLIHKGRDPVNYKTIKGVFTNSQGKKILLGVGMDVTEIMKSKQETENANKLLDAVINALPFYLFAKDVDHGYRYSLVNKSFAKDFVGREPADILGKSDYDLFPTKAEADHFRNDDLRVVNGSGKEEFVERVTGATGGAVKVLKTTKQLFTTTQGQRLLLGITVDLTRENNLLESALVTSHSLANMVQESVFTKNLDMMADVLKKQVAADRIAVWHVKEDGFCSLYRDWHTKGIEPIRSLNLERINRYWEKLLKTKMYSNQVVFLEAKGESEESRGMREFGALSAVVAPIFVEDRIWGVLHVAFIDQERAVSDVDEGIMKSMCNLISLAWIRAQQLEAIRKSNYEKQLILNTVQIPLCLYDNHGWVVRVNTAMCRLMNRREEELLGISSQEYIQRCGLTDERETIEELTHACQPMMREVEFRGRRFSVYAEPVLNEQGELVNVITSAIDVTDLKTRIEADGALNGCMKKLLGEEEPDRAITEVLEKIRFYLKASRVYVLLYHSEEKFIKLAFESAQEGSQPLEGDFEQVSVNEECGWYQRLLNHRPLFLPDTHEIETKKLLNDVQIEVERHDIRSIYAVGIYLDGKLQGSFSIVYEKEGRVLRESELRFIQSMGHILEIGLDRKRGHEKLIAALKEARDANKAKSYFLASMSHELRTPLNAVIGFSELLREGTVEPETQHEYLNNILFSSNALLRLINDVLDLSKLESGQMAFQLERCRFDQFCSEIIQMFSYSAQQKSLVLENGVEKMPLLYIDELRMRQILFNLVGNAVKYTERGKVRVSAQFIPDNFSKGTLTLSVSDTGIGIKPEDQKRMFEPFVQLSRMRGTNASNVGTGLGLVVTLRLVEKMGGKLTLESEVGKGSTFRLEFPDVAFESQESLPEAPSPEQGRSQKKGSGAYKTVLLVDDVDMNLKVLEASIKKYDVEVTLAHSGDEALKLMAEKHYDLVMTDLWMPEMSGEELAWSMRCLPLCAETKVVAITADMDSRENFSTEVFDDILRKPITPEQLEKVFCK